MAMLPPGFRFHPTDEELVGYYLKRKVGGLEIELEIIPVIEFYKYDPWELPDKSYLLGRDMEWFFFCPRDKKYPNGSRTNRATRAGYWKATGKDRKVVSGTTIIGYRKTLVFYNGRAPLGDRTDWVMHEYRLSNEHSAEELRDCKVPFALCRVMKKNEAKLSSSNFGGNETSRVVGGNSSINLEFINSEEINEPINISDESACYNQYNESKHSTPISSPFHIPQWPEIGSGSMEPNQNSTMWVSPDLILDSSKENTQGQESSNKNLPQAQMQSSLSSLQPYGQHGISPSSSYSNFTEDIECIGDLSHIGCWSPYPGNMDYLSFCGDGDIEYQGYDQIDSYTGLF